MRHKVAGKKLGRDSKQRKALFKNLINSLIKHGSIKTTLAKAKAIRRLADRIVTLAKEETSTSNRQLMSFLNRKDSIDELKSKIVPKLKNRVGGYLKMVRIGKRIGDHSEQVVLKWSIDKKNDLDSKKKQKKQKSK